MITEKHSAEIYWDDCECELCEEFRRLTEIRRDLKGIRVFVERVRSKWVDQIWMNELLQKELDAMEKESKED